MRLRAISLVFVLAAGGARVASAATDFLAATTYCNSGQALRTCAAFQITTASDGSGGTLVTLLVRNLAGTHPYDNTGGSFMTKIGLANGGIGSLIGSLSVTTNGAVNTLGNPSSKWSVGSAAPEIGILNFLTETGSPAKNGGIQGCPVVGAPSDYFQTCDSAGATGWVQFSFHTSLRWYASDALIAYKVQGTGIGSLSLECISNPQDPKYNCTPVRTPPDTPVPEPATTGLLATGLIALGAVGMRRRRQS